MRLKYKEPTFSLWALYHPGNMYRTTHRAEISDTDSNTCPCGCAPKDYKIWQPTCEQLGIKGTPALLAIAVEKAREPKALKVGASRPWKGATQDIGEVSLQKNPIQERSKPEHEGPTTTYPARVYRLGNAVAYVRQDAKVKL